MSTDSDSGNSSTKELKSESNFEVGGWGIDYDNVRQTNSVYTAEKENYEIVVNETDIGDETYRVALLENKGYGMDDIGEGFYADGLDEARKKTVEMAQLLEHFGLTDS